MYKIRSGGAERTLRGNNNKNRCKPSKNGSQRSFLERVDEKDAPYMSVAVYMLYGCFTLQRKPWRSGDLFASSISNEQQAPN